MEIKYMFILFPLIFALLSALVYGQITTQNYTTLWSAIIFISVGVGVASGIQIFGSGMSSYAVKILFFSTSLGAIWTVLIFVANPIIDDMPYGNLIFFILTIMYIFGIILNIAGGGGEE